MSDLTDYKGTPVTDYEGVPVTDYATEARRFDWLIAKTLLLLGDPNGEKYAQARIMEVVNFACLEIAMTTELIKDEIGIQIKANQAIYDIAQAIADLYPKITDYEGAPITDYQGNPITDYSNPLHPYGYPARIGYNGIKSPALLPTSTMVMDAYTLGAAEYSDPQFFRLDMLSYGQIQIDPVSLVSGNALPDTAGNLQVTYVGLPLPMEKLTDYPDPLIPSYYHEYIPFFAARLILDEGDAADMALGDRYAMRWQVGMNDVKSDSYNLTSYSDSRPL